jgi:hypothetical protein
MVQFTILGDAGSGIKKVMMVYLNGKWILFEHDHKTKKITHTLMIVSMSKVLLV